MAVATMPETLHAVGVRCAHALQLAHGLQHPRRGERVGLANPDGEAVAPQLSRTQLAVVSPRPQHLHRRVLEHRWIRKSRQMHRHGLPSDRLPVLHARMTDRGLAHAAVAREHAHHLVVGESELLDAHVQVLTLAARLDERDLVHEEVLGALLDDALHARHGDESARQQRAGEGRGAHGRISHPRNAARSCGSVSRVGSTCCTRQPAARAAAQFSARSSK